MSLYFFIVFSSSFLLWCQYLVGCKSRYFLSGWALLSSLLDIVSVSNTYFTYIVIGVGSIDNCCESDKECLELNAELVFQGTLQNTVILFSILAGVFLLQYTATKGVHTFKGSHTLVSTQYLTITFHFQSINQSKIIIEDTYLRYCAVG